MRPAIRAIAAGRVTSASILQGSGSFAAAAGATASATLVPAGGYNPADRGYWPGGAGNPVGLTGATSGSGGAYYADTTTTVSNRHFTGQVRIDRSFITFNNCWFDMSGGDAAVKINVPGVTSGVDSRATFNDCLFSHPQVDEYAGYATFAAVAFAGTDFNRCEFRGFHKAWEPWANYGAISVMNACWIHSMSDVGLHHREAIHWEEGGDFTVRNCWIENAFLATANLSGGDTGHSNILIENNVIGGEGIFGVQLGGDANGNSNCIFRNNRWLTNYPLQPGSMSVTGYSRPSGGYDGTYQMAYIRDWQVYGNIWHNTDGLGRVAGGPANLGDPGTVI